MVNIATDTLECFVIYDGSHKGIKFLYIANFELLLGSQETCFYLEQIFTFLKFFLKIMSVINTNTIIIIIINIIFIFNLINERGKLEHYESPERREKMTRENIHRKVNEIYQIYI